jgi:hypothetical protein
LFKTIGVRSQEINKNERREHEKSFVEVEREDKDECK